MTDDTLFDVAPYTAEAEPIEAISADRRRTQIQAEKLAAGWHPLSGPERGSIRLHKDAAPADDRKAPGLRCGGCKFRAVLDYHRRSYPKCVLPGTSRLTHGTASDVRSWWPACSDWAAKEQADG